jgi:glycosyltransferase involved in cell wall biosynthesis
MKPIRILFFAGIDVSLRQGHAVHVRRLCESFERRGHRIRLLALDPSGTPNWGGPNGGLLTIRRPPIRWAGHLVAQLRFARAIRAEIRKMRPDLLLMRLEAGTLAPIGSLPVPLLVESNASVVGHLELQQASRLKIWIAGVLERRLLRRAVCTGAVTPRLAEIQILRHGIDPERIVVVPNGASLAPLQTSRAVELRRSLGVPSDRFVIGFVGSLNPWQGLEDFLDALARLSSENLELWVVGDGVHRRELESRTRRLGLPDRVRFLGGMPESAALLHAQAAQLLIAPYPDYVHTRLGGQPLKIFQAMACDRPLLYGAAKPLDFVQSIGAGEAVSSRGPEVWAQVLSQWIRRWRDAGAPLRGWPWREGEGPGRRFIARERTWDHTAEVWEREMLRVLSRRR